ncbi:hypothetical protein FOA43_002149 [Brettanomyces nanus]|uniref:candidapepsin n=1 Tax=Eeniella nana TaxID=13502 RepID=A0A875S1M0_EENNA|nr:uncharacterized protein FOA43_002149 [Brettanomyces nanus]QPG74813.1 hypothetical protein FOA43_002149 [Brettanomyces nanus]
MLFSFPLLATLASLSLVSTATASGSPGYIKLDAQKFRGNSWEEAKLGAQPRVLQKRDSDGTVTMILENEQTFYQTILEIGSTKQRVAVLVDTGSSDLWVVSSNNTGCLAGTTGSLSSGVVSVHSSAGSTIAGTLVSSLSSATATGSLLGDIYSIESDYSLMSDVYYTTITTMMMKGIALSNIRNLNADIGSPTVEKANDDSDYASSSIATAEPTLDCSEYGTFNSNDSDTFSSNNTAFSIEYADDTFAIGIWGNDNVMINSVKVSDLSFAVCDDTDNQLGVLGIGLPGLETTYGGSTSSSTSDMYMYANLPIKMRDLGLIESVSYSVYLNDSDSSEASILFGAIDHDKYVGDLSLFPIINSVASYGYKNPIRLEITLNSLNLGSSKEDKQVTFGSGYAPALLDTGTTLTYMPTDILDELFSWLSVEYSSSLGYYMKCDDADGLSITFNFQGVDIRVPLSDFLVTLTTTSGSTSSYCMVGLKENSDESFTLGDSFLRNVYFAVDMENYVIAMAPANLNSTSEDIEVISSSIPSAVSAPDWSMSYGGSSTLMTEVSTSPVALSSVTIASRVQTTGTSKSSGTEGTKSTKSSSSSGSSSKNSASSSSSFRWSLLLPIAVGMGMAVMM